MYQLGQGSVSRVSTDIAPNLRCQSNARGLQKQFHRIPIQIAHSLKPVQQPQHRLQQPQVAQKIAELFDLVKTLFEF